LTTKQDIRNQICEELRKIATMALHDYQKSSDRPQFYADVESVFGALQLYKQINKRYCLDLFNIKQGCSQKTETMNMDFALTGELKDAFEPVTDFTNFQHPSVSAFANSITVRLSRTFLSDNEKFAVKLSASSISKLATLAELQQVQQRIANYQTFLQLQLL
jgi:hypothetical protein